MSLARLSRHLGKVHHWAFLKPWVTLIGTIGLTLF
jgi:hypothetical protein